MIPPDPTRLLTETYYNDVYEQRDATDRYEVTARRMMADHYDFLLGYLVAENFADNIESAAAIIENMSESWFESVFNENLNEVTGLGRVAFRSFRDALKRGMRVDPETKAFTKQSDLENAREILATKYHKSIRGVKNAPIFVNTPQATRLDARIDRINAVRRNTP